MIKVISLEAQRTLFGTLATVMLAINVYLAVSLARIERTVVLVPTIDKEMTISTVSVSEDYLLYRAEQIMQLLFNIRHENFAYNVEQILKQVSSKSRPDFSKQLEQFTEDIKSKRYFYVFNKDGFEINPQKLEVTFSGYLEVYVNNKKIEENYKRYRLVFDNRFGLVKLVGWEEVIDAKP